MAKYKLRNDWVLIRTIKLETVNGIVMPDSAIQGKEYVVEAKGPFVDALEIGDKVLLGGTPAKDGASLYFPLPNEKDLLVIQQQFVILTIKPEIECYGQPPGYNSILRSGL